MLHDRGKPLPVAAWSLGGSENRHPFGDHPRPHRLVSAQMGTEQGWGVREGPRAPAILLRSTCLLVEGVADGDTGPPGRARGPGCRSEGRASAVGAGFLSAVCALGPWEWHLACLSHSNCPCISQVGDRLVCTGCDRLAIGTGYGLAHGTPGPTPGCAKATSHSPAWLFLLCPILPGM